MKPQKITKVYETPKPIFVKDSEGLANVFADIGKGMKRMRENQ